MKKIISNYEFNCIEENNTPLVKLCLSLSINLKEYKQEILLNLLEEHNSIKHILLTFFYSLKSENLISDDNFNFFYDKGIINDLVDSLLKRQDNHVRRLLTEMSTYLNSNCISKKEEVLLSSNN